MQCSVLCQVQAVPPGSCFSPVMPSVSLPCLQDSALVFTAYQNRALLRKDTTPLSPDRLPPSPHPVFRKSTYTFHPKQTRRSPDPATPPPFLFQLPFWSLRVWGNRNRNPVLNRAPDLWEHPPALCVDQLSRKMRPTGKSFNQGQRPSLGNGRPSGGPNPSTDPARCAPLGNQWRAIWSSLLPSARNREGQLSIRTLSLLKVYFLLPTDHFR